MQMGEHRFQEALPEYETALSLDRNLTSAQTVSAFANS